MPLNVGETVYVEGWSTDDGIYVTECKVMAKRNGRLELERQVVHTPTSSSVTCGSISNFRESWFDRTLEDRLRSLVNDITALIQQFSGPNT
jgi:hypothetical protein